MANDNVDNFQVRTITESSTVLKKFFIDLLEEEGWFPGRDDIDIFLACDPTSLYVGELNGKPITIGALFKYNEEYGHFGCYVTNEDQRGGGYGFKLAAESWRRCQPIENLGGFSALDMIEKYGKSMDAVAHWPMERHIVDIPTALSFLKDAISANASPPFSIKQVSDVELKALFDYDTKVFGYKREKCVDRLLQVSHARVAVSQQHAIVGYAAARVLYNPDNGYRVGPVFAESIEIAKCLLVEVFQDILHSGKSAKQAVVIDLPLGGNPAANELANIMHGKFLSKCVFASINGRLPKSNFKKWFAITTLEAG